MKKQCHFDLCNTLVTLAKAYQGSVGISVEEYFNSYVSETGNNLLFITFKQEIKELLKLLIENPKVAEEFQHNILGNEIMLISIQSPEKMEELKETIEKINKGELKFKIPDRLKN